MRLDLLCHKKPVFASIPSLRGQMRGDEKPIILPSFPLQEQLVPFWNKSVRGNLGLRFREKVKPRDAMAYPTPHSCLVSELT